MSFSEIPLPPETRPGCDLPVIQVRPPGPQSRTWLIRHAEFAAPMGQVIEADELRRPRQRSGVVYSTAFGANVLDVDGNRYVDLAAGFGAQLIGHRHPHVARVLALQSERLTQALGDVYPAEAKVALCERLTRLFPEPGAQVILGQSGADAVSAALKTAVLATGKPGVLAFRGGYHGLSYGPLAVTSLRDGYRAPFAAQLNPSVRFVPYPGDVEAMDQSLEQARFELMRGDVGAVIVEPILGRGGVLVPPSEFLTELAGLTKKSGALLIADEIWTGLGRAGELFSSQAQGVTPDLVCLGKGLGGGLPISACVGRREVMAAWRQATEVVHTATFAGAPLACATAIATLDVLRRERLIERSATLGAELGGWLRAALERAGLPYEVRGRGMMWGIDLASGEADAEAEHIGARRGARGRAAQLAQALLERGYITSTGGGERDVLVLTPPLTIAEEQLEAFVAELPRALQAVAP
ncbi:MAG: aminotransferase class III-fold pyridoxal phosphate-dependent enzyme [Polyangiaceae bacterium]|nr:aminotransferase class III-fold pyridoxal phosphate-dependent enzyme [Polyangiaceae bacterium]MCW5789276.1 aminotransferase class III-fold pyridoxal phosphate-dependent enzyme [Polyangiaceae bacterium]